MSPSVSADTPAALRAVPLFAELPDERLNALWAASVPQRHPAGQVLRRDGDPAGQLLLLLRGRVSATVVTTAGRLIVFGTWTGPRALDKVAVIDGGGHSATLTALTPCLVRALPRERFLSLTDEAPVVRAHVLRVLATEVREQRARFTAAATLPAEARIADWLLLTAAGDPGGVAALPGAGTQQDLADLLGLSRVTVNRALARLRRDGLIEIGRRTVRLRAPELLRLRAQVV